MRGNRKRKENNFGSWVSKSYFRRKTVKAESWASSLEETDPTFSSLCRVASCCTWRQVPKNSICVVWDTVRSALEISWFLRFATLQSAAWGIATLLRMQDQNQRMLVTGVRNVYLSYFFSELLSCFVLLTIQCTLQATQHSRTSTYTTSISRTKVHSRISF